MIGFTVAGRPVNLLEWRFDVVTNHGDRALTGKLPKDVTWAEQDAPIVAWRGSGDPAWSGFVSSDPADEDGLWSIRAHGQTEAILEPQTERMFYRRDGGDGWVDQDAEPHNFATFQGFDTTAGKASLKWAWGNNADVFANGDHAGFILWLEGTPITSYSVAGETNPNVSNVDFVTRELTGPDGTSFLINTHSLSSDTTYTGSLAVAGSDALWFRAQANAAATPALRRRLKLTSIRVYGRTTDNNFSVSDVVNDVGTLAGLDVTNVQAHPAKALPLDWTDDHPGLLTYMAEQVDWRWMVTHTGLEFGPYERTWTVYEDDTAGFNFVPERRYNKVVQPWRNLSGIARQRSATATVDPFPGEEVVLRLDELEDPQPDGDLAEAVAQARVDHEASLRVTGNLEVRRVRLNGPRSPYDVRAGDLLVLPELHPLGPQRIEAVTYEPDDRVSVELGDPFNLPREIAQTRKERRRQGGGRKKPGRFVKSAGGFR